MELLGLMLGCPVALAASIVWCLLARWALDLRAARILGVACSAAVFLALAIELTLLASLGAIAAEERLPMLFYAAHLLVLVALPPAVATILLMLTRNARHRRLALCGCVVACWITCMSCAMFNIVIDEAINGVDGIRRRSVAVASGEDLGRT